ncbi:MAG TPA: hydrogenase subunit MbhD domain-containing protein [Acetobacteraceae bacterium]|jgi:multisubunit Na+/H+ antiporter MnhB subunit
MTAAFVLDAGLALLVVAVAVWTIAAGSAFAAVVGFVTFGLLLALAWVRLAAVDVALTEAAVGSGITGALLITAAARLRPTEQRSAAERPAVPMRVAAGVLAVAVFAGLAALVLFPADPAPTLASQAAVHLPELGVGNAVTAVLIAYRALDTLLEKVVLLLALIGVWSLAPDRFWGGAPGLRPSASLGGELTLLGRLLPPVGIVVGIYILWVGAIAPGGAFQGGAILAAMWLLVMIAGLQAVPETGQRWVRMVLVAGPAVFLAVGFAGFALPDGFLSYPAQFAKPLIIVIEVVLTLSIAAILGLLVAGPPERERQR